MELSHQKMRITMYARPITKLEGPEALVMNVVDLKPGIAVRLGDGRVYALVDEIIGETILA